MISETIRKGLKKQRWLFLSYGLTAAIILLVYAGLRIYPFGDTSIVKADLLQGYLPVFHDFAECVRQGKSVLYSWSGGLGSSLANHMLNNWVSIFTFPMFLFPSAYLTEAIAVYLLLKIPTGAVTFHIYLRSRGKENQIMQIGLSVMYALCAYVTSLYWNIMWLDAVILLPLVALGLEKLVKEKRADFYCAAQGLSIFCFYGTAFFLCGFSVLYFILLMALRGKDHAKEIRTRILLFLSRSLLAGAMCAAVLIPIVLALQDTHYVNSAFPDHWEVYNSFFRFFTGHYFGMHPTALVFSDSIPNIYCGILTVCTLPLYYGNRNIQRKEKIAYTLFLFLLFLCFDINILTFIVHGFHFPSMMPHRYSFIYSFLLLFMAWRTLQNLSALKNRSILAGLAISVGSLLLLSYAYPQSDVKMPGKISGVTCAASLVLILFYFSCLLGMNRFPAKRRKQILQAALLAVVCLEAAGNTWIQFGHMNDAKRDSYRNEFSEGMEQVTGELQNENEFYRAEFKHEACLSDSKLYGYNGINMFAGISSSLTGLMDQIGVTSSANSLVFSNPTPLLHSIFAVKYQFNRREKMQDTFTLFQWKEQKDNVFVYENPYVLPLGFMVKDSIMGWDIYASSNPFVIQNAYGKAATGSRQELFENVSSEKLEEDQLKLTKTEKETTFSYLIDDGVTAEQEPSVFFTFRAEKSAYTYLHMRTGGATQARVWVNDRYVLKQNMRLPATALDAGYVEAGDTVRVQLVMNRTTNDEKMELIRSGTIEYHIAQMDLEAYENTVTALSSQGLKVNYYDNASVSGTVRTEQEGYLFTSIPYDRGWSAEVDGKKVNTVRIGEGLMGIKLYPGEHKVEFAYHMRGALPGIVVSLGSLLLWISLGLTNRKRQKRKVLESDGNERFS